MSGPFKNEGLNAVLARHEAANPNASRPTLTLLGKKPIALAAYKAKLKIAEPEPEPVHVRSGRIVPDADVQRGAAMEVNPDVAGGQRVQRASDDKIELAVQRREEDVVRVRPEPPKKPLKPRPPAQPFVQIEGEPVPPPEGEEHTPISFEAVTKWLWKIQKDLVRDIPEGRRKAARKFCARNRRAIADAFERRLSRIISGPRELKPFAYGTLPLRKLWRSLKTGVGGSASFLGLLDEWLMPWKPGQIILGTSLYEPGQKLGRRNTGHVITIATSQSGKGRSCIIPNLLTWPGSALVVDPKGQNAAVTVEARRAMRQKVHIVDPFKMLERLGLDAEIYPRQRLNPLAEISLDDPEAVDLIRNLAAALVMISPQANPFWDVFKEHSGRRHALVLFQSKITRSGCGSG